MPDSQDNHISISGPYGCGMTTRNCSLSCVRYRTNNRPIFPIPECTFSMSHNTPSRTEMCTFLFSMEHRVIGNRCISGICELGQLKRKLTMVHTVHTTYKHVTARYIGRYMTWLHCVKLGLRNSPLALKLSCFENNEKISIHKKHPSKNCLCIM